MMVWMPLVFCMRDGVPLCGSAFLWSRPSLFLARSSTPVVSDPMRIVWKGYRGNARRVHGPREEQSAESRGFLIETPSAGIRWMPSRPPRLWYRVPMYIVWKGYYGAVRAAA